MRDKAKSVLNVVSYYHFSIRELTGKILPEKVSI